MGLSRAAWWTGKVAFSAARPHANGFYHRRSRNKVVVLPGALRSCQLPAPEQSFQPVIANDAGTHVRPTGLSSETNIWLLHSIANGLHDHKTPHVLTENSDQSQFKVFKQSGMTARCSLAWARHPRNSAEQVKRERQHALPCAFLYTQALVATCILQTL